jgi:hypothetical protein
MRRDVPGCVVRDMRHWPMEVKYGGTEDAAGNSAKGFAAGLLATFPEWAIPALGQNEVDIPFTDLPANFNPGSPNARSRLLDIRKIDRLITPKDQFFAVQHFGRPEIDPASSFANHRYGQTAG